jgi:putative protease
MRSEIRGADDKRPEILAPVNALEEVVPLIEAGAHWLYGGVVPGEWADRFPSTVLLNQRTFASAQFPSMTELGDAVLKTREHGGAFAMTLNAPFYMDEQIPLVLELAGWAVDAKIGALIVADPGLIVSLRNEGIELPLHLSTMGIAANAHSVKFYTDQGISRVILPRFLSLAQISTMTAAMPSVEYEAFILVGKCPHIEGICTFVHDSPDRRWPCEWEWDLADEAGDRPPANISEHFSGIRENDRRDGCGLCALPGLKASGVLTFKIVGRGAPLKRKLQLVRQLKRLLGEMPSQPDEAWLRTCKESYHALYGHHCCEHNCYYPEVDSGDKGSG